MVLCSMDERQLSKFTDNLQQAHKEKKKEQVDYNERPK